MLRKSDADLKGQVRNIMQRLICYNKVLVTVHPMKNAVYSNIIVPQCIVLLCGLTIDSTVTSMNKQKYFL